MDVCHLLDGPKGFVLIVKPRSTSRSLKHSNSLQDKRRGENANLISNPETKGNNDNQNCNNNNQSPCQHGSMKGSVTTTNITQRRHGAAHDFTSSRNSPELILPRRQTLVCSNNWGIFRWSIGQRGKCTNQARTVETASPSLPDEETEIDGTESTHGIASLEGDEWGLLLSDDWQVVEKTS